MNVAGAPLHRIAQHHVHQLDHGGFVGGFLQFRQFQLLLF